MPKLSVNNFSADSLRIKLRLSAPELSDRGEYDLWALSLFEKTTLASPLSASALEALGEERRLFVEFFLQTTRNICELGKLPVFDVPRIISLTKDAQDGAKLLLEIDLIQVAFVPKVAYQIVIQAALELCQWMAGNSPTLENKNKVFKTILEKVIKPLHTLVPAGKSTIPVLKVAHSLGIPFMHLGAGVYQLGWGSKARRLDRSASELDSAIGAKLAQNKVVTANLLRLASLPAATHIVVNTEAEALSAAKILSFPLVVKPVDRDRGEGVTVDVMDVEAVKMAFSQAQDLSKSKQVIVERQVSGVCHRLFIANGQLLYAVKRLPMSVKGDGRRTVAELVAEEVLTQENRAPWLRSEIQPIDERALVALEKSGFSPESIPGVGIWVPLRRIESTADGGVDEEVTTIVHSANVSAAIAAAQLFGLHIAGIDIISSDISKPWYESGAIINEVNFAPLLGGGEISRSHLQRFLADYIAGDGRIPIEIFDSEEAATVRQEEYRRNGLRCYFTTSATTIDSSGNTLALLFNDLRQRVRALLMRSDADAITAYLPPAWTSPASIDTC